MKKKKWIEIQCSVIEEFLKEYMSVNNVAENTLNDHLTLQRTGTGVLVNTRSEDKTLLDLSWGRTDKGILLNIQLFDPETYKNTQDLINRLSDVELLYDEIAENTSPEVP